MISNIENNQHYQEDIVNDTYSLTIYDVHYEDAGNYTLNVENQWGKATCTAELFISIPSKNYYHFPMEMIRIQLNLNLSLYEILFMNILIVF